MERANYSSQQEWSNPNTLQSRCAQQHFKDTTFLQTRSDTGILVSPMRLKARPIDAEGRRRIWSRHCLLGSGDAGDDWWREILGGLMLFSFRVKALVWKSRRHWKSQLKEVLCDYAVLCVIEVSVMSRGFTCWVLLKLVV